jgi:hypothetical protein
MNPKRGTFEGTASPAGGRSRLSQTARATLLLREMVIDGHFLPGERIKEIPLASRLGVSRIPLRLALEERIDAEMCVADGITSLPMMLFSMKAACSLRAETPFISRCLRIG